MKKLMIAAAIVCAAAMSQAATCYWSASTANKNYVYADASNKFSGDVYLIWTAQVIDTVAATIDQQYILNNYAALDTLSGKKLTADTGVIAKTSWNDDISETGDVTRNYIMAIVNGDNVFVSETYAANESTQEAGSPISIKLQSATKTDTVTKGMTYGGAGWYTQAVPEPTSGLLLLLGIAGLALRRRRA